MKHFFYFRKSQRCFLQRWFWRSSSLQVLGRSQQRSGPGWVSWWPGGKNSSEFCHWFKLLVVFQSVSSSSSGSCRVVQKVPSSCSMPVPITPPAQTPHRSSGSRSLKSWWYCVCCPVSVSVVNGSDSWIFHCLLFPEKEAVCVLRLSLSGLRLRQPGQRRLGRSLLCLPGLWNVLRSVVLQELWPLQSVFLHPTLLYITLYILIQPSLLLCFSFSDTHAALYMQGVTTGRLQERGVYLENLYIYLEYILVYVRPK